MLHLPAGIRYVMSVVFLLSFIYVTWQMLSPSVSSELNISDKLVHFLVFGWLALTLDASGLLRRFLPVQGAIPGWQILAILLVIYGGLLEIGQWFVPGRSMSFLDWLADIAGVMVYCFGMMALLTIFSPVLGNKRGTDSAENRF